MRHKERRWFCPCGFNVADDAERIRNLKRHRESGEHERMVKVNAVRDAMSRIDTIIERHLESDER